MAGLKFSIHPLFLAFGIYFAFIGKVFSFIIYTLSAVIHEMGHYIESEKLGYALEKIVLMPYGAIIKGDLHGISYKDECKISLSGPLYNLIIAVVCVAFWWLIPETYPYTDLIVTANLSLAIINLIPCYPLDGGRFLLATLSLFLPRKTAKKIVKGLGLLFVLILLALFVYSCFTTVNITLLFFSVFMLIGVLGWSKESEYIKIYQNLTYKKTTNPRPVKRIIIGGESKLKNLYKLINAEYYYEVKVESKGERVVLEGDDLYKILSSYSPYQTLNEILSEKKESL